MLKDSIDFILFDLILLDFGCLNAYVVHVASFLLVDF